MAALPPSLLLLFYLFVVLVIPHSRQAEETDKATEPFVRVILERWGEVGEEEGGVLGRNQEQNTKHKQKWGRGGGG